MDTLIIDNITDFSKLVDIRIKKKIPIDVFNHIKSLSYECLLDIENGRYPSLNFYYLIIYCQKIGIKKIIVNVDNIYINPKLKGNIG